MSTVWDLGGGRMGRVRYLFDFVLMAVLLSMIMIMKFQGTFVLGFEGIYFFADDWR